RDFKLRCIVTDGSNTIKTSNEFYVDILSEYPPQQTIVQDNSNEQKAVLAKEAVVESIPQEYSLKQNYPNPFNPATKISYSLPKASHVTLIVYDMLGREVKVLVNENKPSGNYEIDFHASGITSGSYIYRMIAGNYQATRKLIVVK
ncbi:MAG: T9SS type A sorting domain-containing protein, partial [Bacteroidota bacterium]